MNSFDDNVMIIGITGGIGSGKSTVAEYIKSLNHPMISTDDIAKEIMRSSDLVKKQLVERFGAESVNPDGEVNSKYISDKVFGKTEEHQSNLDDLNSIVHPFVIEEMIKQTDDLINKGEKRIFIESALIFEAELEDGFDYIISVDAPEEMCVERVMKRSGLSLEEVKNRIENQMSPTEKSGLADFSIINDSTLDKLKKATDTLLMIISAL